MGVSNVIFGSNPIMDITDSTVTPEHVENGYVFYGANGERLIGNMQGGGGEELANSYTAVVNNNYRIGGSCAYMFSGNDLFNQPVTIGDNVTSCSTMFNGCFNFNKPVTIGNNVTNCVAMFYSCWKFNQPITIPNKVNFCNYMFLDCRVFNQPITIPDKVLNCAYMFNNCGNFNQPITIPDNVTNCAYMFQWCYNFNKSVTIGYNVLTCAYMFNNCRNLNQNIYIKSTKTSNVVRMLYNHNNQKMINLFCTNLASLNKTTAATSLVGAAITWTAMTNGYYNATYNVYLYNNLPAGI